MNAQFYVGEVHKAVGRIKEAHDLNILSTRERNVEFTARTAVILDIAIVDPEISSDDYVLISNAIGSATKNISDLIFDK